MMKRDEKLLLVEDNPSIVAAFERAGEQLNMQIEVATDGWDAIEKLRNASYAGIVIDTDLPRHSGYGLLNYLREENGDEFGNVVVVSNDRDAVRQRVSDNLRVIAKSDAVEDVTAAFTCAFASVDE
jgi:DNA-binding response OmpR family regulator